LIHLGGKFIGVADTEEKMTMVDLGAFPGVIREPKLSQIRGEAWEVPEEAFQYLDGVEGVPDLYTREEVDIINLIDVGRTKAYIYIYNNIYNNIYNKYNIIKDGNYSNKYLS
jgi:gamma-glutamylcyclotransferase (GGCT)/AIG2-like uncharacterized protein YtfP